LREFKGIELRFPGPAIATPRLLAEFDAEARFQMRAERGRDKAEHGVALLRKALVT